MAYQITRTTSLARPARRSVPLGILLTAGAATSTLELLDGVIGKALTVAVDTAGTGYEVGDLITLPSAGGEDAVIEVVTVDTGGEVLTVSISEPGSGFVAAEVPANQTTDSVAGANAVISVTTVGDDADTTSIAKISTVANTSSEVSLNGKSVESSRGLSVKITGSGAIGYLYAE